MVADAARGGFEAIVVVHNLGGRPRALFAAFREHRIAHDVIENHHALGAGHPLEQALHFGIVDRLDLLGIVEILDRSFVRCKHETVGVEREFTEYFAAVADSDAVLHVLSGPAWNARRRMSSITS